MPGFRRGQRWGYLSFRRAKRGKTTGGAVQIGGKQYGMCCEGDPPGLTMEPRMIRVSGEDVTHRVEAAAEPPALQAPQLALRRTSKVGIKPR